VTLEKLDAARVWHTINDKGTPDHEVVWFNLSKKENKWLEYPTTCYL
jgi:hypothetical protein